ncbi:DUF1905 domain-containing protein [Sphingomonas canadensis]|uniref:DUF1905 domain-containing protein n=1 Tax=Sphingomonas canadensis TaxID=1219257 RepID=A0ABW3H9Q3_9SPHN|nr:DUF1905 domain-containing protein [Sphingomonas canadensis]MCW3837371.1 DUF1905 domain-containing protein [Sphingomonas canadensis]
MPTRAEPLLEITFDAEVIHWRGPAPFLFLPVPEEHVGAVRFAARAASYGWGCVPATATIGGFTFTTSLFPRDGGYLLPLKVAAQRACGAGLGDRVTVSMRIDDPLPARP